MTPASKKMKRSLDVGNRIETGTAGSPPRNIDIDAKNSASCEFKDQVIVFEMDATNPPQSYQNVDTADGEKRRKQATTTTVATTPFSDEDASSRNSTDHDKLKIEIESPNYENKNEDDYDDKDGDDCKCDCDGDSDDDDNSGKDNNEEYNEEDDDEIVEEVSQNNINNGDWDGNHSDEDNETPLIPNKLLEMLDQKAWDGMLEYIKTEEGKLDASTVVTYNERGLTDRMVLHAAVIRMAPIEVIDALLAACPRATHFEFYYKRTALHLVFTNEAIHSARSSLYSIWDRELELKSSSGEVTSLQDSSTLEVTQSLLKVFPEALHKKTDNDMLPLHSACTVSNADYTIHQKGDKITDGSMHDVIQVLLQEYPQSISQKATFPIMEGSGVKGMLPIHFACAFWATKPVLQVLVEAFPNSVYESTGEHSAYESTAEYNVPSNRITPNEISSSTPFEIYRKMCMKHHRGFLDYQETRDALLYLLDQSYPRLPCISKTLDPNEIYGSPIKEECTTCEDCSNKSPSDNDSAQEQSLLLSHYLASCGAPPQVTFDLLYKDEFFMNHVGQKKNRRGRLDLHCALQAQNVFAALLYQKIYMHIRKWPVSKFSEMIDPVTGLLPLHMALVKNCMYDGRRNRVISLIFTTYRDAAKIKINYGNQDLYPLQIYLLKLLTTQDADSSEGCGGVVSMCPMVIEELMHEHPSVLTVPFLCQRMRSGHRMLSLKWTQQEDAKCDSGEMGGGVSLTPFQIVSLLVNDVEVCKDNIKWSDNNAKKEDNVNSDDESEQDDDSEDIDDTEETDEDIVTEETKENAYYTGRCDSNNYDSDDDDDNDDDHSDVSYDEDDDDRCDECKSKEEAEEQQAKGCQINNDGEKKEEERKEDVYVVQVLYEMLKIYPNVLAF